MIRCSEPAPSVDTIGPSRCSGAHRTTCAFTAGSNAQSRRGTHAGPRVPRERRPPLQAGSQSNADDDPLRMPGPLGARPAGAGPLAGRRARPPPGSGRRGCRARRRGSARSSSPAEQTVEPVVRSLRGSLIRSPASPVGRPPAGNCFLTASRRSGRLGLWGPLRSELAGGSAAGGSGQLPRPGRGGRARGRLAVGRPSSARSPFEPLPCRRGRRRRPPSLAGRPCSLAPCPPAGARKHAGDGSPPCGGDFRSGRRNRPLHRAFRTAGSLDVARPVNHQIDTEHSWA